MKTPLALTMHFQIAAPKQKVWEALTNPAIVKKYFFGTDLVTDWKPGNPIYFRGSWEGKAYEDKGVVVSIIPGEKVHYTYWSSMAGKPDQPENYANITYEVKANGPETQLTITQDGIASEESRDHSRANWEMIVESMKKVISE